MTPEEFLESKGWSKDSPVVGGMIFAVFCDLLKEYEQYNKYRKAWNILKMWMKDKRDAKSIRTLDDHWSEEIWQEIKHIEEKFIK